MKELLDEACAMLADGEGFVLAKVINRSGSAPRTAGARMLVALDGTIHGTIGGGQLEARAIEAGRELCRSKPGRFLRFDLNNDNVAEMDMICGGAVDVLLDCIQPTAENRDFFRAWRQMAGQRRGGWAVTIVREDGSGIEAIAHGLLDKGGLITGDMLFTKQTLDEVRRMDAAQSGRIELTAVKLEDTWIIIEPLVNPQTVCIFGAGHVAQPTARIAAMMGFRVEVFDDRDTFANAQRFPEADQIHVLTDFDSALNGVSLDEESCVVILTRGHLHDKTVLKQALKTRAGYIGMIGSRHKRDAIYQALLQEGFREEDLKRVSAPIGLAIGAESPEEIALSVVAELVQHRAARC
ncbi:MAG: XdhC family aldehyde oxidoreductase maturation factor [Desulfobacterales bacterium]